MMNIDMVMLRRMAGKTETKKVQLRSPGRQDEVYAFIVAYKREHDGNSPTIREIGAAIGVRSSSHISWCLERLETRGLIRYMESTSRGIEVMGGKWDLAGGGYEKNG